MLDDNEFSEVFSKTFCETSCAMKYVIGLFYDFCSVGIVIVFYALECGFPQVVGIDESVSFGFPIVVSCVNFADMFVDLSLCHSGVPSSLE